MTVYRIAEDKAGYYIEIDGNKVLNCGIPEYFTSRLLAEQVMRELKELIEDGYKQY